MNQLQQSRDQVHATHQRIIEEDRFTDYLDPNTLLEFPIGIKRDIGGLQYIISIDSVVITPTGAFLNASLSFKPPQSNDRLAFRATKVGFSKNGGLTGEVRLELMGDHKINLVGNKHELNLLANDTYVEWDCGGFRQFGISAEMFFSSDILRPAVNRDHDEMGEKVKASFRVEIIDWNDLIAEASITPFEVNGVEGYQFEVGRAIIDLSDIRNPNDLNLPQRYVNHLSLTGVESIWRGFYLNEVVISLPDQFNKSDVSPAEVKVNNLILDAYGLSADITGSNILVFGDVETTGNMSGWNFSLDQFTLDIFMNDLKEAKFQGQLELPISGKDKRLKYLAFMDVQNRYFFRIETADSLNFPLWGAGEVELYPSSYLAVRVVDGEFVPRASLSGKMQIGADVLNEVKLVDIEFEELLIATESPRLSVKAFSFGEQEEQLLGGFPLNINQLSLKEVNPISTALNIQGQVNLSPFSSTAISAESGLNILSDLKEEGINQRWDFKALRIENIELATNTGAFEFIGSLQYFEDHIVNGNGFQGNLQAWFMPGIEVEASAMFGQKNGYRFWYADALATMPGGIPIMTGLNLTGFGGGASSNMKMKREVEPSTQTKTGIRYVPDESAGLGLKATINVASTDGRSFNGDLGFIMNFKDSGGLQYINMSGNAYFASTPVPQSVDILQASANKFFAANDNNGMISEAELDRVFGNMGTSGSQRAQIAARANLSYDFTNKVFHANMQAYVNTVNGLIIGSGPAGMAGWGTIHFAPHLWFIHLGNPSSPLGLNLDLMGQRAKLSGYLMIGDNLPGSPPPPLQVSRILGNLDLNYMRDENALGEGKGIAFGGNFLVDTGEQDKSIFYGRFMAGAGFDLMLKNYGQNINCAAQSTPLGINGWYGNGQAYGYFDGKIGIRTDLFGKPRRIDIINISAAAILQAKLPNPFWMRGMVGGQFSVLGGLLQGDCQFEVTIGELCDLSGTSVLEGFEIISQITPDDNANTVSVFNNPQVIFNIPVGKVFKLIDNDEIEKSFRIKMDYLKITQDGKTVNGNLEWNDRLDVVAFNSNDILPPQVKLDLFVQVSYEQFVNGSWKAVTANGNILVESKVISFTTGDAPDHIPMENIASSYPVIGMLNYYNEESERGHIKLKKGQSYLFENVEDWEFEGSTVDDSNSSGNPFLFEYDAPQKQVNFKIPSIKKDMIYALIFEQIPVSTTIQVDENVTKTTAISNTGSNSSVARTVQIATGTLEQKQSKVLLEYSFRSSKYSRFSQKLSALIALNTFRSLVVPWRVYMLRDIVDGQEAFDETELFGNQYSSWQPLISIKPTLIDNDYYNLDIYPLIYKPDHFLDFINDEMKAKSDRLTSIEAVNIRQNFIPNGLNDIHSNTLLSPNTSIDYWLPTIYYDDFKVIQTEAIVEYSRANGNVATRISNLAFALFPVVRHGSYNISLMYQTPLGESEPRAFIWRLNNPELK